MKNGRGGGDSTLDGMFIAGYEPIQGSAFSEPTQGSAFGAGHEPTLSSACGAGDELTQTDPWDRRGGSAQPAGP